MVSSSLLAEAIFVGDAYTYNLFHMKTLRLLKQARMKIVARAFSIYLFFFLYIHSLLLQDKRLL